MSFVYILHFDTPHEHAQHYVGSTENLKQRLIAHANDAGARLTEVVNENEISWRLGGLLQCTNAGARRAERQLKEQKNAHRYCQICSEQPSKFPQAKRYPIESLPFPIDSPNLRKQSPPREPIIVRAATLDDFHYVQANMATEKVALGFIPLEGIESAINNDRLAIVANNDQPVGYAIYTTTHDLVTAKVHQCYIQDDARMKRHGECLIRAIQARHPTSALNCKVRDDLPANLFWEAIGFSRIRSVEHKTSKQQLNMYHCPPLISLAKPANPSNDKT